MVVGTHHDRQILNRNDDDEGPKSNGNDTEGIDLVSGVKVVVFECFAKCVERRSADVAIHNAEGTKCKGSHADLGAVATRVTVISPFG